MRSKSRMSSDPDLAAKLPINRRTVGLESWLQQLLEGDFQARWEAAKRIEAFGEPAIARLITLLQDEDLDWEIRWFIARTLGNVGDEACLQALMQLLQQTQEPELIAIAAEALSQFKAQGVQALKHLLGMPPYRMTAIQALARIRHPSVIEPLLIAAQDADAAVRGVAVAALGYFRSAIVDTQLLKAVQDSSATVRQEAMAHLGLRAYLLNEIDLVETLGPGLWDLHPQVNKAAAIALGRLGTDAAIAKLAKVLTLPNTPEHLQIQIVRSLSWIEKESALSTLLAAWQNVPVTIQLEIAAVLSRLETLPRQNRAGKALCQWLDALLLTDTPEHHQTKQGIAIALGNLHYVSAQPLLQKLAQDSDAQTRLYAEAALRQLTMPTDPR
ncbi:MAG: HEAT repeat domain-containing protein [Cyanobacteria bacterium P01_H01_bin.58]